MGYQMYFYTPPPQIMCLYIPQRAFLKPKFLNIDPPEILGGLKYKIGK